MDNDKFALVEKILKDIENILLKNADLNSFEIVPVESNFQNKSPVLLIENSLGLESWCVKHVYMFCYSQLIDDYLSTSKRKCLKSQIDEERLIRLLNLTLLINPDIGTLWNKRRELVLRNLLGYKFELKYSKLTLSRKPKCNDAFSYRRWILERALKDNNMQSNEIDYIVSSELNICDITSERSPNNYHSWSHRIWLINNLKTLQLYQNITQLFIQEYYFAEKWTSQHVSDFSCHHYKQFCIKNILNSENFNWNVFLKSFNTNIHTKLINLLESYIPDALLNAEVNLYSFKDGDFLDFIMSDVHKSCSCSVDPFAVCRRLELLVHELVLNNEIIKFYKHHETLWYHRRFIIHEILLLVYDYYGLVRQQGVLVKNSCKKCNLEEGKPKNLKIFRCDGNIVYSSLFCKALFNQERYFVGERRIDGDNYADRHDKYLKYVQGINDS